MKLVNPCRIKGCQYAFSALAAVTMAMVAMGDTYTLVNLGSSSEPVEFSDPANWTVNDVAAATCPQAVDTLLFGTASTTYYAHLALDGDYEVSNLTQGFNIPCLYRSANASATTVSLTFTGKVGGSSYQYYYANAGTKLIFAAGSELRGATSDWNESRAYASQTGEIDVLGSLSSRHMNWYVSDSAKLYFAPTSYAQTSDSSRIDDHFSISGGSATFPNGLTVTGGNSSFNNTIAQTSGSVTFGGNFTSANSPWTYTFSGGTLATTANCAFGGNVALVIPASANVTLDVASGTTFSAANFSADSTATIVKNGGGTFAFAPTTAPITVNEGAIGLSSAATYDLSNVSLGGGASASIALIAFGARVDSLPAALAGATFTADLSSATAGTVVFYSADSAILGKVKTDLTSSVPAGFELVASGEVLSLEVVSEYVFNKSGNLLSDTANWSTSSLPGDNLEVAVSGAGVVAEYTGGTIPAWASIEVKDGATLKISADCALPPIALNKNATLEIASGSTFLTNGLSGVVLVNGDNVTLPVLSVAAGATLNVPGGMKFKNVDISLNGTLTRTTSGNLVFGHAESGETSYIGFHANAAKITNYVIGSYGTSICICCPDAGGSVRAVGALEFKDMPTSGTYLPESGDNYWNGLALGDNNPSSIPFEVVFDNTKWSASGISKIAGAATFRLKNGSRFANKEHDNLYGRRFDISELGKVVLEDDSELCIYAMGDWGSRVVNIQSAVSGGVAVEASGDSRVEFYRTAGNDNAVMAFSNSIYRIYRPSIYHDNNGTIYNSQNEPFRGLKNVTLAEGSTLTFSTWNGYYFKDDSGDRIVSLADVPITGGGSLVLSNDNVNVFGVIVRNGANGATGTASVMEPASGKGATTLYFANGANWAGTVVAGNVALTNLTDAAAAASVSFGALSLPRDSAFPVRVWSDGNGDFAGDTLDVGQYENGGGRLTPVNMTGAGFNDVCSVAVGKIAKGSPLPRAARGWFAEARPIDGDDANDQLVLIYGKGLQVILR